MYITYVGCGNTLSYNVHKSMIMLNIMIILEKIRRNVWSGEYRCQIVYTVIKIMTNDMHLKSLCYRETGILHGLAVETIHEIIIFSSY